MKNILLKSVLSLFIATGLFSSCVNDDEYGTPKDTLVTYELTSTTTVKAVKDAATNAPVNTNTEAGSQASKTTRDASTITPEMQGQTIYNAKCGSCHYLKVTTDYTADRWISIMQVMAIKANLNDTEKENVLAYVKANAKK